MDKLLITNSCSFLGANLVRYIMFNKLPYQVIGSDFLNSDYAKSNIYINKYYKFYIGNSDHDPKWLNRLLEFEQPKYIVDPSSVLDSVAICKFKDKYHIDDYDTCNIRHDPCFGIRQEPHHFISRTIKSILQNEPIKITGDGSEIQRLFIIDDLIEAIFKVIKSDIKTGSFNLISAWEISDLELVNHICNIMGRGHNLIKFVEKSHGSHPLLSSSLNSQFLALNWTQSKGFKAYLEQTVQWYLNNQWYFKLRG